MTAPCSPRVIVLAAGVGSRLGACHDAPKCLLNLGGKSLVRRYIEALRQCGVHHVTYVLGYQHDKVEAELRRWARGVAVRTIINPMYQRGSVVSLHCARSEMEQGIVLMDGDVLFHPGILGALLESQHENCLVLDTQREFTDEEVMVGARDGRVVSYLRGAPPDCDVTGEWVGFLKMDTRAARQCRDLVARCIAEGNTNLGYEDVLPDLFRRANFGYEVIDGLPWVEIDFPEDAEAAARLAQEWI